MKFRALTSAMIAISLAACGDAQVDSDYPGEPLATVEGTITNQAGASKGNHEASLLWLNDAHEPNQPAIVSTKAPVKGNFPASFRLNVYTPPPDNALVDYTLGGMYPDEVRLGLGYRRRPPSSCSCASPRRPLPMSMPIRAPGSREAAASAST